MRAQEEARLEVEIKAAHKRTRQTDAARFAVGYFFLSGLTPIAERLSGVKYGNIVMSIYRSCRRQRWAG